MERAGCSVRKQQVKEGESVELSGRTASARSVQAPRWMERLVEIYSDSKGCSLVTRKELGPSKNRGEIGHRPDPAIWGATNARMLGANIRWNLVHLSCVRQAGAIFFSF